MGCYDTIYFNCPECGEGIEAQSKSGDCLLDTYHHTEVPIDVAQDCNRHAPFECSNCKKHWKFKDSPTVQNVDLEIEKA